MFCFSCSLIVWPGRTMGRFPVYRVSYCVSWYPFEHPLTPIYPNTAYFSLINHHPSSPPIRLSVKSTHTFITHHTTHSFSFLSTRYTLHASIYTTIYNEPTRLPEHFNTKQATPHHHVPSIFHRRSSRRSRINNRQVCFPGLPKHTIRSLELTGRSFLHV